MWCEPAENIMGADTNGDGVMYDRNESGEHSGVDTKAQEGGNENEQRCFNVTTIQHNAIY